jgi:integrase
MQRDRRVPGSEHRRGEQARSRGPRIYRRGSVWWAYLPGRRRESLHTEDEDAARQRFAELLKRCGPGGKDSRSKERPLAEIANQYLESPHGWTKRTLHSCELRALGFVKVMETKGVRLPSQLTDKILDDWRRARMKAVSRATVNRDEVVARRMLAWAAGQKPPMCGPTPLAERKLVREPRRGAPPFIPSPREVRAVVDALESIAAAAKRPLERESAHGAALTIGSGLVSGMRLDELRHVQESDVHTAVVYVTPEEGPASEAWTSKGYRKREIPVGPDGAGTLRAFVRWRESGRGGKGKQPGISDGWVADWIDKGLALANKGREPKIETFRAHDLRRVFATELRRAGVPITTIRDLMGHRDTETTERYLGRYRDDDARVVAMPASLNVLGREASKVVPMQRKQGA